MQRLSFGLLAKTFTVCTETEVCGLLLRVWLRIPCFLPGIGILPWEGLGSKAADFKVLRIWFTYPINPLHLQSRVSCLPWFRISDSGCLCRFVPWVA